VAKESLAAQALPEQTISTRDFRPSAQIDEKAIEDFYKIKCGRATSKGTRGQETPPTLDASRDNHPGSPGAERYQRASGPLA